MYTHLSHTHKKAKRHVKKLGKQKGFVSLSMGIRRTKGWGTSIQKRFGTRGDVTKRKSELDAKPGLK